MPTPHSPSYPSEHAATAAAAAAVLSYFFPNEAATFQSLAEEAGKSRIYAGLQFPTDYSAGLDLGRKVAARVIELAKADGSDAVWTGTVPTGKCMWIGSNPGNVTATTWKPFLLTSPNEFRPPVPPACDSSEMAPQVAEVRDYPRSFTAFPTNQKAMYWQSPEGLNFWTYRYADKWMFEDKLNENPPRTARVYALVAISMFDAFIASQDGKFTYWYIRPPQLEPSIVPLFPVPNFPSYPSNHSTFSATRSEMLAYLFPRHADEVRALGKEGGDSRIWAGIHYQMDNQAGVQLGRSVVGKFIAWANADGSQWPCVGGVSPARITPRTGDAAGSRLHASNAFTPLTAPRISEIILWIFLDSYPSEGVKMKRLFLGAALFAAVLIQTGPLAQGCGDKLLALGRGVRFQRAFAAAHPAALLIFSAPGSGSALTKDRELHAALRSAGHKLVAVEDARFLQQILGSGKYDLILTDVTEAPGLAQASQAAPSRPSVVPVMYKPEKAALAAAARQYSLVLKAPAKSVEFLAVIEQVMKRRTSSART